jgi:glycosyltransferase involved in cell wall biosynthesis
MKILLANKFYYPRGGDCIYTLNLESLLRAEGHEVAVFAIQHPQNNETPFQPYFPSEVSYSSVSGEKNRLKAIFRPLGTQEVKQKFTALLNDFQPDIVHLNNIHTHLSPVLAEIAHQKHIRVVWTLHDYKLLCPSYLCLRNDKPCELCFRHKSAVLKYRCVKNSCSASLLAYLESLKWNRKRLERYTDIFICPSEFMKEKMLSGGFSEEKLKVIPNFTTIQRESSKHFQKENYYAYIGRISKEKGIETLIQAAQQLPYPLKIAGKGPLFEELKAKQTGDKINFLGYLNQEEVTELIEKARFTIMPSECYDNNPLAVIESLYLGTPVLGANIGGIPELIETGANGLLFEAGNSNDLKAKITEMHQTGFNYPTIAKKAQFDYSAAVYYAKLMPVYCGK